MKVLSIGNRMSSDAHAFMPHLAKACGMELLLSNLCLENASIEDHYRNYTDENEVYFYETYLPGVTDMMRPDGIALHEAVEEEDWDVITIQQNGILSGSKESYVPYYGEVAAYCRLMHPGAKILLVQPWAFDSACPLPEYRELYGADQDSMYEMIGLCCKEIAEDEEADGIIPVGRAFQTVRQTQIGDRLTENGMFANDIGRFTASCAMFEALTGINPADIDFDMPDVPKPVSDLIKLCAHIANEEGI